MSNYIDHQNERVIRFFKSLNKMVQGLEKMTTTHRKPLNGQIFLSDKEVSERLKISRRTLQSWRDEGVIEYYQMGGKILYSEADLQKLLDKNFRKAWREE